MVEVTSQMLVIAVVAVLVALVIVHLQGRKVGWREQEERYNAYERPEWEEAIAQVGRQLDMVKQATVIERQRYEADRKTAKEQFADVKNCLSHADQRELRQTADLANARRRIDFFWQYACKLSISAAIGPQIRFRKEPQDRDEFDATLTKILAKKGDPDE